MSKFNQGDTAFIVESHHFIREVKIIKCSGGMYTIKFIDSTGGIKVREHRLFSSKEEAESSIKN